MLKLNKLALCLTRNALLHWFSACFCRALFCLWVATLSSVVHAQTRSAFVVGNNEYVDLPSLANAINDATGLAAELRKSGFEVTHLSNAKASVFKDGLARFLGSVANGGTGVFYFAGHGAQILGRNYLAPVDFSFNPSAPTVGLVSLPELLNEIDKAKPKLVVIILDACRDEPFPVAGLAKPATRGLAEVARPVPAGTLVIYAASSNQTALDVVPGERSSNGLFTGTLLEVLRQTDIEIRDVAQRVRYTVMQKARASGHLQIPAIYENLSAGEFYLSDRQRPAPSAATISTKVPPRIKVILPFAAGGPSDVLTRAALPLMAQELGREVTAENIIDVQGDRVAALLASGAKDGSTLLVSPFAAAARRLKANDDRLAPIGMLFDTPLSIAVNAVSPARSVGELLDATTQAGRKLVMQVARPPGSPTEICGQQALKKFGADRIELVPVNGEALAVQALVEGKADLICTSTMALRNMAANQPNFRLKELAEVRWSASPSTETLRVQPIGPQGYDIIAPNWLGVFVAAEVDREIKDSIAAAIGRLQRNPTFAQAAKRAHGLPVSSDQATADGLLNALRLGAALQEIN
jgi:tripartite-type tricarboxylate transporter receptor subunit TctC